MKDPPGSLVFVYFINQEMTKHCGGTAEQSYILIQYHVFNASSFILLQTKKMIKQYATKLGAFSSQYGTSNSVTYVVQNVLREPTNYPSYGDFTEACVMRTYGEIIRQPNVAYDSIIICSQSI